MKSNKKGFHEISFKDVDDKEDNDDDNADEKADDKADKDLL